MGLGHESFSMLPACFASIAAGKWFRSPLFPRSLLSWALPPKSQREERGGAAHPPPAAAEPLHLPHHHQAPQVPWPALFKICLLSHLLCPFSPFCDKEPEGGCEQQTSARTVTGAAAAGRRSRMLWFPSPGHLEPWQTPLTSLLSCGTSQWILPAVLHLYMDFGGG